MRGLIAHIALLGIVPLSLWIFGRWPRARATAFVVVVGSLFLPDQFGYSVPLIRALEKQNFTYLAALAGLLAYHSRTLAAARPGVGPEAILLLIGVANFGTVLANPSAMWDEGVLEPGLGARDVVAHTAQDLMRFALPFFLGRAVFRTREDLRVLLVALATGGLAYAVLIGIEVALSIPFGAYQISHVVYGIGMPVSRRWGLAQPHVFMHHGLAVATYMAASTLAVVGLARARMPLWPVSPKLGFGITWIGLVLARNVAGIVYGTTLSGALAFLRAKTVATVCIALAVLVCTYPSLRISGLFPVDALLELAEKLGEERHRSLKGRFGQEEYVLEVVEDRSLWGYGNISRLPGAEGLGGWEAGGFGGGIDGYWLMEFGIHGSIGLALRLAPLVLALFFAWRAVGRLRSAKEQTLLVALMAIVAMRSVDLLVNGWWNNLPMFLAGALYALSRTLGRERPGPAHAPAPPTAERA